MIKHLRGISKEEMVAKFKPEQILVKLSNYGLLSLDEKIDMFKRIPVEKRVFILHYEYGFELSSFEMEKFTKALTDKRKLQKFYNNLTNKQKVGFLKVCAPTFLKNMNIKL